MGKAVMLWGFSAGTAEPPNTVPCVCLRLEPKANSALHPRPSVTQKTVTLTLAALGTLHSANLQHQTKLINGQTRADSSPAKVNPGVCPHPSLHSSRRDPPRL